MSATTSRTKKASTRRTKKAPQLPAALQTIGRRCAHEDDSTEWIDASLGDAYRKACALLADASSNITGTALEVGDSAPRRRKAEREMAKALRHTAPRIEAREANLIAEDLANDVRYDAVHEAFFLGLAVAYEVQRAFIGAPGGAR
jgi:hypothetical protein